MSPSWTVEAKSKYGLLLVFSWMDLHRFRSYTAWHDVANERRYAAPAPPWRLLQVAPGAIEHVATDVDLQWGLGRVTAGDWDDRSTMTRFDETAVYRGLRERIVDGRDWDATSIVKRARRRFERGERVRGYDSLEAFRTERCSYIDELVESIRTDGYRPNDAASHEPADSDNRFETAYVHEVEPLVVVCRDGDFALAEGFHRVAIAAILDLEAIPVQVLRRHEAWQRRRDRIHRLETPIDPESIPVDREHPDLADVLPEN